jgi:3'-5' exonuclease
MHIKANNFYNPLRLAKYVMAFDLETVPDLAGYARANGIPGSDEEIAAAMGNRFPKHIYHSIICIGTLEAHRDDDGAWKVDACGAPHVGDSDEKQLIRSFVERVSELRPVLVSFNGNSFDLPVLRYRAMVHGLAAPGLNARKYFNRYGDDAVDLCDLLSSYSPTSRTTLNEFAKIIGLPGKPDDIDGSLVSEYFKAGRIREIADYCKGDVLNTFRLWLRYELFWGMLNEDEFEQSERNLSPYYQFCNGAKISSYFYECT